MDLHRHNGERQLQRLIDAYQQEVLTLQELAPRREQITQRLKGLAQERTQLEQQRDTTIKWEHIASNIEHFRTLLGSNVDRLGFEDRQTVVQLLVEKVVVSRDGAVEVHHVLPFEEQPIAADQKKKASRLNFMSCDYNISICHRMRPSTKTSRNVKRSTGTLVTKSGQAASASRVALTWRPLARAAARKRRRRVSATS